MNTSSLIAAARKQPIGVVSGILCVVCAFLLYYRSDIIVERQAEYEAKSAEAEKVTANVRNSANLAEQVAEIQAFSKEMESRLIKAGQLAVNLQYFYKLEAENEVKLVDIRQNNLSAGRSAKMMYAGVPYNVGIQGGYKQVLAFLSRLEAGRHFCRFNNVNLTKSTNVGTPDAMSLTLGIELLGTP